MAENSHPEIFEFRPCSLPEETMTQIERLEIKKVFPTKSIPAKVLEETSDLPLPHLVSAYNSCIPES